jgi:DNA-binding transcriptional ArsR family regulator
MPRRALPRPPYPPRIAGFASVLADRSRAEMLDVLLDGAAHAIGALARRVGISPATASSHLRRLADAGLVLIAPVGRERHVRLAGPDVAEMIERLAVLAAVGPSTPVPDIDRLRFARTCYDHLAGFLGVALTARLLDLGWVRRRDDELTAAPALISWLAEHGQDPAAYAHRPMARACIDWTERVPHLAGRSGAALAAVAFSHGWLIRVRASRAIRLTDRGRRAFAALGVALPLPPRRA